MTFKLKNPFQFRKDEAQRLLQKYPDKVPIICEKMYSSDPDIAKIKYLIHRHVKLAYFIHLIRKNHFINKNEAIFIIINGVIPSSSCYFDQLYEQFKDEDGLLYINYSIESVFG